MRKSNTIEDIKVEKNSMQRLRDVMEAAGYKVIHMYYDFLALPEDSWVIPFSSSLRVTFIDPESTDCLQVYFQEFEREHPNNLMHSLYFWEKYGFDTDWSTDEYKEERDAVTEAYRDPTFYPRDDGR